MFYFARCVSKLALYSDVIILNRLEISRRTRWWCLKRVIVYLARDIPAFVMYCCVNGESGSSLLIESTDSMIQSLWYILYIYMLWYTIYSCGVYKRAQSTLLTAMLPHTDYLLLFVFKILLHNLCACVSFCSCVLCNVIIILN